jgi:hypothetical protein
VAQDAGWDDATLAAELRDLEAEGVDHGLVGFSDEDRAPEEPANPVTRPGGVWLIGRHRSICGDCRDFGTVRKVLDGARANVGIASPPYATQREFDPTSGIKPVPLDQYAAWYAEAAANVAVTWRAYQCPHRARARRRRISSRYPKTIAASSAAIAQVRSPRIPYRDMTLSLKSRPKEMKTAAPVISPIVSQRRNRGHG